MVHLRKSSETRLRPAVAAVELAVVLPFLVFLLVGLWEVGRMVEVQQMLTNAVREGGRQASTGIRTTDQVKQAVVNYLNRQGISAAKVGQVTITNKTDASRSPDQANQMDQFQISIALPLDSVRWIMLPQLTNLKNMTASADWYSMRDIPINVSATIPLQ